MFGFRKKTEEIEIGNYAAPSHLGSMEKIRTPHMGGSSVKTAWQVDITPPKSKRGTDYDSAKLKNILFCSEDAIMPTAVIHYRMWIPALYTGMYGYANVRFVNGITDDNVEWADMLVVSRCESKHALSEIEKYKKLGKKIAYDTDDNLLILPYYNPAKCGIVKEAGKDYKKNMERIAELCDVITVSTHDLHGLYTRMNSNVHTIRNFMDFRNPAWDAERAEQSEYITVGFAGSSSHTYDLVEIVEPLKHILRKYDNVRLAICGPEEWVPYLFPDGVDDERILCIKPTGIVDYPKIYKMFDINLAPLAPTDFNRFKSSLKLQDAGALGVPSVASRITPFIRFANDGCARHHGDVALLCGKASDWIGNLSMLIENETTRRSIGARVKEYVRDCYDAETHSGAWWSAYKTAFES